MGQTGVGKIDLAPIKSRSGSKAETGEISDSLGRGRHTIRAVSFTILNGGKISRIRQASRPSIMKGRTSEDLNQAFPEIADVATLVKFRTCTHALSRALREIAHVEVENSLSVMRGLSAFLSEIESRRETYKKSFEKKSCQNRRHYNDENNQKLHPQILRCRLCYFGKWIETLRSSWADYAHIDVMDGHLRPISALEHGVVESMSPQAGLVFDCPWWSPIPNTISKNCPCRCTISSAST